MGLTMTSVSIYSIKGFNLAIVAGILVDCETYLMPKLRTLDPTNYVLRFKNNCK